MAQQLPWWSLMPTIALSVLTGWAISNGVNDPDEQQVVVQFPTGQGSLSIASKKNAPIRHDSLVQILFKDDFSRNGLMGVLRERYKVYDLNDAALADGLARRICEPIPEQPLSDRIEKAQNCAGHPVVQALRSLARDHKVPFHYVGAQVQIGVQYEDQYRPGEGRANVCRAGPYVGQRLQLVEPVSLRTIEVEAAGVYNCTLNVFPEVQLDPVDAQQLYRRPVDKYEQAIVVPL